MKEERKIDRHRKKEETRKKGEIEIKNETTKVRQIDKPIVRQLGSEQVRGNRKIGKRDTQK